MGSPNDGGRREDDDPDRGLYGGEEDEDYAGYRLSDDQLADQPEWVTNREATSVDGRGSGGESSWLERVARVLFSEEAESTLRFGNDGIASRILKLIAVLLVVAVLLSVVLSTVGFGGLSAMFTSSDSSSGNPGGAMKNASSSVGGLMSDLQSGQSKMSSRHRTVRVVGVSTGSSFSVTVPGSESGSVHRVRLIAAIAPPPSGGIHSPMPSKYGLTNTSANRSCLNAWGERGISKMRSWVAHGNVTVVAPMRENVTSGAGDMSSRGTAYYVVRNNSSVSGRVLRKGLARVPSGNFTNRGNFTSIQSGAKRNGTGVWGCPVLPNGTVARGA